jgi:hypothetical protein
MLRIDQSRKFGSQPRDILWTPSKDYAIENHGIHKEYELKQDGTGTVPYGTGTMLIKYFP